MSLLTQFYPSSSGGGGASASIGYLSGFPYGDTGVQNVSFASYNQVTGVYYLASAGRYVDPIYGSNQVYYAVYSGDNGRDFTLSFSTQQSYNQNYSWLGITTPGSGSVNDSTLMGLGTTNSGTTGSQLYATPPGGGAATQAGFIVTGYANSSFLGSAGYYTAGNRYYYLAQDGSNYYSWTATNIGSFSQTAGLGAALSSGLVTRGRTEGYYISSNTLYKTTDGGLNWTQTGVSFPVGSSQLAVGAEGTGNIIIGSGYYTTNDGASWLPMTLPAGVSTLTSVGYSDLADRYIAWAPSSLTSSAAGKMLVSTDGTGSTWTFAASGDSQLAAQLSGRTLGVNAALGLGTNLYYMPPFSSVGPYGSGQISTGVIAQVDVSLL
jgi:hypothetical protein